MGNLDAPRRVDGLEIHDTEDGWIVYDAAHNRVHHMNASAVAVLELCDGELTVAQMAKLVGRAYGASDAPVDDVVACVAALRAESLVD